jgi:glycosyltransferase involved in cell wall biosynthesis
MVYGGINVEKWKKKESNKFETKELDSSKTSLISDSILIACIGQITRWKNQTDFICVAKIISEKYYNIHFLIIGDDLSGREKKYKNELMNLVESHNLQDRVHFSGHQEDIKEVMNSIDILVHPAINEPFGRVLIEAMALEKPIVAYNCGGPSEIIIDGETGFLVEPHNFEQLAEKTMKLINDKEICIRMGKAGRQRVVEKFNIERYVREMEEVFDNVMEHG